MIMGSAAIELNRDKPGRYSNNRWLIYKKGHLWYLYFNNNGKYEDYCGIFTSMSRAKQDVRYLDKIGYGK